MTAAGIPVASAALFPFGIRGLAEAADTAATRWPAYVLDLGCRCEVVAYEDRWDPARTWMVRRLAMCTPCWTAWCAWDAAQKRAILPAPCQRGDHEPGPGEAAGRCYTIVRCRRCSTVLTRVDSGD